MYAALTSTSKDKDVAQKVLKEVLDIEPTVDWGVGIEGKVKIPLDSNRFEHPFANGTFTDVHGQCLVFNGSMGAYVEAKEVVAEAKKGNAGQVRVSTKVHLMLAFVVAMLSLL